MGFFQRIFNMAQSEAHSALDKLENPIKLTEQGIRDLKNDLSEAMKSLAEIKAISIRLSREIDEYKYQAADYEKKAMLLLEKGKKGELNSGDCERLALEALSKKEEKAKSALSLAKQKESNDLMVSRMESNVYKLKSQISTYENELITLRARYKTAEASSKLNKQLSKMDSSGTIAMLEKMKNKVEDSESLSEAYGDLANNEKSIDKQIDSALTGGGSLEAQESLRALKNKMGIS